MQEMLQPTPTGAALFVLRILCAVWLPGAGFWFLGLSPFRRSRAASPSWVQEAAAILINGILWLSVIGLAVSAAGLLKPVVLLVVSVLAAAVGIVVRFFRSSQRADYRPLVLSAAAISILSATAYLIPRPGEWIVGGWDPGIYLNQGILISRHHGLLFPAPAHLKDLSPSGLEIFTRGTDAYREIFPGVPLDTATRRPLLYFFPLTSVGIAVMHCLGGFPAAVRSSWWFGILAPLLLVAALRQLFTTRAGILAFVVFVLHPLFLYHLHLPVSETLQLALLCALLACAARPMDMATGYTALFFLILTLNRLTFFVFGALWTAIYACSVRSRKDKSVLLLAAALVLGYLLDRWFTPATFLRRGEECFQAWGAGCAALIGALSLRLILPRLPTPHLARITALLPVAAAAALSTAIGTLLGWNHLFRVLHNLIALLPFAGLYVTLLGAAGLLFALTRHRTPQAQSIRTWILFFALALFALLAHPAIAPLYPWATRRYLAYVLPLTCFSLAALVDAARRSITRTIITIAASALLALQLPGSYRALTCTEYDGVCAALTTVSRPVSHRDIIVADHPKWGTPLALALGHQVLDGRRLWRRPQNQRLQVACSELLRLQRLGYRILFLTSDEEALAVFPLFFNQPLFLQQASLTYRELIHHPRARTWKTRNRRVTFRLYAVDAQNIRPAVTTNHPGPRL